MSYQNMITRANDNIRQAKKLISEAETNIQKAIRIKDADEIENTVEQLRHKWRDKTVLMVTKVRGRFSGEGSSEEKNIETYTRVEIISVSQGYNEIWFSVRRVEKLSGSVGPTLMVKEDKLVLNQDVH